MGVKLTGAAWFKSSYSQAGSECLEVAWLSDGGVGGRDSKNPAGAALVFAPAEWDAFVAGVQDGEFGRQTT
ncbi:DUF397 domain-containing protein [Nocardia sp. CA-135953]|uniref:DUF397 domain-containing protein n=1 Tax=Nocardia sp. CA-135953 TaxID=3239978 RepID=UPI003D95A1AE